jgi:nicotinamide-nucleotide amidase
MKAAIITIGDELLIGQTVDTNSAWMGAELSKLGFDVCRITSVHDRHDDIIRALDESSREAHLVLITGGLGPTSDDITKNTLAEYFNTRLVMNDTVLGMIEEMMSRRSFPMNENNRRQAEVPESCRVLTNSAGTAPGMWFEKSSTIFISMPGVPNEMKHIMKEHVLPDLSKRFRSQVIIHKNIMTYGIGEAVLAEILTEFEAQLPSYVRLAYLPSAGIIKLRLTATGLGKSFTELESAVNEQVRKLYDIIPQLIYGEDEESFEMVIGKLLRAKKMTLCSAESCTGGEIAHLITTVPGSSDYYTGSVIAYSNSVKTSLLSVNPETLAKYGAVSEEVVREMAEGARLLLNTDFAVATSGIAGPDGGSETKPAGTVWIAVASKKGCIAEKRVYGTDRIINIKRFSIAALNMLRLQIINA